MGKPVPVVVTIERTFSIRKKLTIAAACPLMTTASIACAY
jgi:hypothetical protein